VRPHAIRVQLKVCGELVRTGRPLELRKQPEEPGARRLCQYVALRGRSVHNRQFCTLEMGKANA
jgi:hypothetical protein